MPLCRFCINEPVFEPPEPLPWAWSLPCAVAPLFPPAPPFAEGEPPVVCAIATELANKVIDASAIGISFCRVFMSSSV